MSEMNIIKSLLSGLAEQESVPRKVDPDAEFLAALSELLKRYKEKEIDEFLIAYQFKDSDETHVSSLSSLESRKSLFVVVESGGPGECVRAKRGGADE